jgi:RHS repeat-associated protein
MKFTGHELDGMGTAGQGDDLYNMHARFYNANIARFLSADLLRGDPHQPQSFNLFAYVGGSPVVFVDPFGLQALNGISGGTSFDLFFDANPYQAWFSNPANYTQVLPSVYPAGWWGPMDSYWGWQHANWWSAPYLFGSSATGGAGGGNSLGSSGGQGTSGCVSCTFGSAWWGNFKSGTYWGTGYGQNSVNYYASVITDPGSSTTQVMGAYAGGALASLWTPETYLATYFAFLNVAGYATGYEFRVGKNWRFAPWGNRTGDPTGKLPHYHHRWPAGPDGQTPPGGGIGWHRPWQP